jgi:lipoprotein-releasing system ATP-binding protein
MSERNHAYLQAHELVKTYPMGPASVEVLKGINLIIERGQTLAVIGASGVGKSTLLYLLGALETPTSGSVVLDGTDLTQLGERGLALLRNEKMGFVFQFHHLLPEFMAVENTAMPALIKRMKRKDALDRAENILVRVGLADRMKHRVGELSGGEQQRVALARALVLEPELLLADEPTGNLDSRTGGRINELLIELNEEKGLTSVVVTHNLDLARMMGRQIRLVDGRAVEEEG